MDSFWGGFEKRAVSMGWVMKKVQGGLASRAKLPKSSLKILRNRIKNDYKRFVENHHEAVKKGLGPRDMKIKYSRYTPEGGGVSKINKDTKFNPMAAREYLKDNRLHFKIS